MSYRATAVIAFTAAAVTGTVVATAAPAAATDCPARSVCMYAEPDFGGAVSVVSAAELDEVANTTVPCVSTIGARSAVNNTSRDVVVYNLPCGDFTAPDPVGSAAAGQSVADFGLTVSFVGPTGD